MTNRIIQSRIINIRKQLKKNKINAALITSEVNRFYFSRHSYTKAFFLITPKAAVCFADGRYYARAKKEIGSSFRIVRIERVKTDLKEKLLSEIKKHKIKILGIEHKDYTLGQMLQILINKYFELYVFEAFE